MQHSPFSNLVKPSSVEDSLRYRVMQLETELELLKLQKDNFEEQVDQAYTELEKEFRNQHKELLLSMEHYQRHFGEIRRIWEEWMYSTELNKEQFIEKMKVLMYGN